MIIKNLVMLKCNNLFFIILLFIEIKFNNIKIKKFH